MAQNTSSSSIIVTWNNVPAEHQNVNITGYKIYIKKAEIQEEGWEIEKNSQKTLSKSRLDLWTIYSVKNSAKLQSVKEYKAMLLE